MLIIMVVLQAIRLKSFPLAYFPMILRSFMRIRMKRSTIDSKDPLITSERTIIASSGASGISIKSAPKLSAGCRGGKTASRG